MRDQPSPHREDDPAGPERVARTGAAAYQPPSSREDAPPSNDRSPPQPAGEKARRPQSCGDELLPPPPPSEERVTVTGTIGDFQFGERAETCGFYLWDGKDVRFPPQLAPSIKRIAIEGSRVHVTGWEHSSPQGRIHLHAERITNADTGESIAI